MIRELVSEAEKPSSAFLATAPHTVFPAMHAMLHEEDEQTVGPEPGCS